MYIITEEETRRYNNHEMTRQERREYNNKRCANARENLKKSAEERRRILADMDKHYREMFGQLWDEV